MSLVIKGSSNFQHRTEFKDLLPRKKNLLNKNDEHQKLWFPVLRKSSHLKGTLLKAQRPEGALKIWSMWMEVQTKNKEFLQEIFSLACGATWKEGLENTDRGEWQESHVHTSKPAGAFNRHLKTKGNPAVSVHACSELLVFFVVINSAYFYPLMHLSVNHPGKLLRTDFSLLLYFQRRIF